MTSRTDSDDRVGEVIAGRWTLERLLGTGATANVYAARDAAGAVVALKLLHPDVAARDDLRHRFDREARVGASLTHPGIVAVIDQETDNPQASYLAMELLEGETLAERAQRRGIFPADELLGLADQILDVLTLAHGQGIVHRDLKPGNLFISTSGQIKLLDFGIARLLDPTATTSATQFGMQLGTVAYMAPELAQGRHDRVDGRTDLFALGAILFRLAAGRPVHQRKTETLVLAAMSTEPAPPLRSVCSGADPRLTPIVDVSLSFSSDARYPDATTMRADVTAALAGRMPPYAVAQLASRDKATVPPGAGIQNPGFGTDATMLRTDSGADPAPTSGAGGPDLGLAGQVIAGRYRIEKLLGVGGMGSVYRAEHVHMRKAVAVKVLHREMTTVSEVVTRFEREAVAAARIDHPNVAAATDFGKLEDGSFYLVLEFIKGQSLRSLLDAGGALAPGQAVSFARQIAGALAAAHAAGIVHRDLKPDNVMLVQKPEGDSTVKVLDFGIAKLSADDVRDQPALTRMGSVFGTPAYMSPEQAMGTTVDHRADLYALGIMLYEMLSGKPPFVADDTLAVLSRQMTAEPPPLGPNVDPSLAAVVMRLLAKRPDERTPSAEQLLAELDQVRAALGSLTGVQPTVGVGRDQLPSVVEMSSPANTTASVQGVEDGLRELGTTLLQSAPLLQRRLAVGGQQVPVWAAALAGVALVAGGLVLVLLVARLWSGGDDDVPDSVAEAAETYAAPAPAPEAPETTDEEMEELRATVKRIEDTPVYKRREPDWAKLARSHARLGNHEQAVKAYRAVISIKPGKYKKDPVLLADLRRAGEDPASYRVVVNLCTTVLGKKGMDLLWDLWLATRNVPRQRPIAELCKKKLNIMRRQASKPLRVAIDLEFTQTCEGFAELLPRVVQEGDARTVPKLVELARTTGCGDDQKEDCYPCLRGRPELEQALSEAQSRPRPDLYAAD